MPQRVWVIEFPGYDLEYPEVWGNEAAARKRFTELYETHGFKENGLIESDGYMSFDEDVNGAEGSLWCMKQVGLNT